MELHFSCISNSFARYGIVFSCMQKSYMIYLSPECVLALDMQVLSTEPRSLMAQKDQCIKFWCQVTGGESGWMVDTGYGEHHFTMSDEDQGVFMNSFEHGSVLVFCNTKDNVTFPRDIRIQCFVYRVGGQMIYGDYCKLTLYG